MKNKSVERFNAGDRVVHWLVALAFVYLALTGLGMWSRKLFWLVELFGGGPVVARWHPLAGMAAAIVVAMMFARWARDMVMSAEDRDWLVRSHLYAMHRDSELPEPGRYNGGQKMMFWGQTSLYVLLFVSGFVLWLPGEMPRALRLAAVAVHPLAAVGSIGLLILHIYMGTAAVPGSVHAMLRGKVSLAWAKEHHPKWFRELIGS